MGSNCIWFVMIGGELLNFCLTKANVDDCNPEVFNVLSKELFGKLYADKGYISKTLFEILFNDELKNIAHAVHSRHRAGKLSNEYDFSNNGILLFPKETSHQMGNRNTEPIGIIYLMAYLELRFTGFPDAISSVFPDTTVQLCIVHQIRNSCKYVGSKHQKEFLKDLKTVYRAVNEETAEANLDSLESKWGEQYPIVIKSWRDNWERLSAYFEYTEGMRRMIYTTNTVEGYHRQLRKVTKNKGVFPNDTALEKLVYLAYRNIRKRWTKPLANWAIIAGQLAIKFGERFRILYICRSSGRVLPSLAARRSPSDEYLTRKTS